MGAQDSSRRFEADEASLPFGFSSQDDELEWLEAQGETGHFDQMDVALRWMILATYIVLGVTGILPVHPLALAGSAGWFAAVTVLSTWRWKQARQIAWHDNIYLWLDFVAVFLAMLATANLEYPIWVALVLLMIQAPAEQPAHRATIYNGICVASYGVCAAILHAAGWYEFHVGIAITATALLFFIAFNLSITFEGNRRLRRTIRGMAITDALTGLPNRRELSRHLATPPADGTRLAVIILDVDRFKQYNDSYGHLAGDQILSRLAEVLRESFADAQTIARYGGDEFVVILPCASLDEAAVRIEAMQVRGATYAAPVSVGVALWPDQQPTLDATLAAADDCLRQAKRASRGTFAMIDDAGAIRITAH